MSNSGPGPKVTTREYSYEAIVDALEGGDRLKPYPLAYSFGGGARTFHDTDRTKSGIYGGDRSQSASSQSKQFRTLSVGYGSTTSPMAPGLYRSTSDAALYPGQLTYNLSRIKLTNGVVDYSASFNLLVNPGNSPTAIVTAMAEQLSRMTDTVAPGFTRNTGTIWWVRPTTAHSGTRDGTSYANAWGTFAEIVWASITAGHRLRVCGQFDDQELVVGSSGVDIELDYAPDPGIIYNSLIIQSGWWNGPDASGEYWIDGSTFSTPTSIASGEFQLYEDGERMMGCSKSSRNTMNVVSYSIADDTITIGTERPFYDGEPIVVNGTGVLTAIPAPLSANVLYYAIRVSDTTCKLATSYANALAGTAIDLTANGTGETWKLFTFNNTIYNDPTIGALPAGWYWWDGVAKRIYYKPSTGTPSNHVVRLSLDRNVSNGACILIEDKSSVRVFGGGQYGGLFGSSPLGKVGQCHTDAILVRANGSATCNGCVIDGVEISGCRSAIGYVGYTGPVTTWRYITSNNKMKDCGWHGVGGESSTTIEDTLLHERNWLQDIGQKYDYGDAQGIVANAKNHNCVFRRNYLQRVGRDELNVNNGVLVFDACKNTYAYRNLLDNCVGEGLETGSGNGTNRGCIFASNIIYRHGYRKSRFGDHRTRAAAVHLSIPGGGTNLIRDLQVFGNLILNSTFPQDAMLTSEADGVFRLRTTGSLGAGQPSTIQGLMFKRNAIVNLDYGNIYASILSGTSGSNTIDFVSDLNLFAGIPATTFAISQQTGTDPTYDAAHIQGSTVGYWSHDTGRDGNSVVLASSGAVDWTAEPTSDMLNFIRQDDSYDTYSIPSITGLDTAQEVLDTSTAPTLESVGLWPFYGGLNSTAVTALVSALNATDSNHAAVVFTSGSAYTGHTDSNLVTALLRCGASSGVVSSPTFRNASAYTLVGIGGIGAGNGHEYYAGTTSLDSHAWTDVTFTVNAGAINIP